MLRKPYVKFDDEEGSLCSSQVILCRIMDRGKQGQSMDRGGAGGDPRADHGEDSGLRVEPFAWLKTHRISLRPAARA